MRKCLKRMLSLAIVLTMLATMAACGGNKEDAAGGQESSQPTSSATAGSDTTPASSDPVVVADPLAAFDQYKVNGEYPDLGGITIVLSQFWDPRNVSAESAFGEAYIAHHEWIEETFNFTVIEEYNTGWPGNTDFLTYAVAGGDEYRIYKLAESGFTGSLQSGLLADVSQFDFVDFSEPKWANKVHEIATVDGKIYAFNPEGGEPRGGMYFNKRLLTEAGIDPEEIYALQESGDWTWEKFEEYCALVQKDTDNDGVTDIYGLAASYKAGNWYTPCIWSNNGTLVDVDSTGKYIVTVDSPETQEALEWAEKVRLAYNLTVPEGQDYTYYFTAFENGEAVFMPQEAYQAEKLAAMQDDFGFVCFPKGPKATDYTNAYSDNRWGIPAVYGEEKVRAIMLGLDIWTDPTPGWDGYNAYTAGQYKNFRDAESVDDTITRLQANGFVPVHGNVPGLDVNEGFLYQIGEGQTVAALTESVLPAWQAFVDEYNLAQGK